MKISKLVKALSVTTLLTASLYSNSALADSSVWKVSKGNDYVYLGGTVHILPTSEFPLPSEFDKAYKDSDAIVLEVDLPDPTDQQAQIAMMQKMTYTDGTKLSDVISAATYKSLSEYLLSLGVEIAQLNGFKPSFIVTMMVMLEIQKAQISGEGVDAYFSKLAKKDNKTAEYLESLDFQTNMLANLGKGHENEFVESSLAQMEGFKSLLTKLIVAWREGDTQTLNELVIKPVLKDDPRTFESMFAARNKNWIPHIEKMFSDQDREFVLVGAGHLVGQGSVIELLKQKGYKVSKI